MYTAGALSEQGGRHAVRARGGEEERWKEERIMEICNPTEMKEMQAD